MKTMITVALLSLGLIACSNAKNEKAGNTEEIINVAGASVLDIYIELKDAFVGSDLALAKTAAKKLSVALSEEGTSNLAEAANAIVAADELQIQRAQFKVITDGLVELLKANGKEDGLYVQFCPMAFNNTGANWLSLSDQIRNPYFGDKMLKCGRVVETSL